MKMTKEEAIAQIEKLKSYCEYMKDSDENGAYVFDLDVQALDFVLSALTQPNEDGKDKNVPTNDPLTLEELTLMIEPTPVWWDWVQGWVLARKGMIISWNGVYYDFEEVKGNFYRRPPEEPLMCEGCVHETNEHENCNYCIRAGSLSDYYCRRPPDGEKEKIFNE